MKKTTDPALVSKIASHESRKGICDGLLRVFLFIFGATALVTFLMPESYSASVRLIARGPGDLEAIQSTELLKTVSHRLDLPKTYAARYGENKPLDEQRVEDLLRRSVQVRRLRGTDLVELQVHGRSPEECARLANEIAVTVAKQAGSGSGTIQVVDEALPLRAPSRPNKRLNLILGAAVGIFFGIMAGGVGAKLAVGFEGQKPADRLAQALPTRSDAAAGWM